MERDTLSECLTWAEFPASAVSLSVTDDVCEVRVETLIGCTVTSSAVVASFASERAAVAYISSEFGLSRQCRDGDDAHEGYWLA
jgi:hypothetical protein